MLVFGNGGSAASSIHFAAEFTGKLRIDREPLPAISLATDVSALTAISNDFGYELVFSRQVEALYQPGDVLLGISTSGNSENVIQGIRRGRDLGALTVSLTGNKDELGAEISLKIPLADTARVQEAHDLVLHQIAQLVERNLMDLKNDSSADVFDFVIEHSDLPSFHNWVSESGQQLITTNGVFDLLHEGHRYSLELARDLGDILVVCLNSDESTRRLKGSSRPVQSVGARISALSSLLSVDHVVVFEESEPTRVLDELRPLVHVKGVDYEGREIPEAVTVAKHGGRLEFLPLVEGVSTTALLRGS